VPADVPIVIFKAKAMPERQRLIIYKLQTFKNLSQGCFRGMGKKVHKNCVIYFTPISRSDNQLVFL